MAALLSGEGFRFLFRQDKGVIARDVWWLGTAMTGALVLVLQLIWFAISPHATSDLSRRGLIDPTALGVYVYLFCYAAIALVCAVSWYNLSAKRFRDRARAPALAGLPLVVALFDAAARWLAPRLPEMVPFWAVTALDIALVCVILWTIFELGIRPAAAR